MATPPQFTAGAILTAAQMNAVGMWEVSSGTLSLTTSPTQVTGVFVNADFPNYRLFVRTTAASGASGSIQMKFLAGTTPASTNYYGGGIGASAGSDTTIYFKRSGNATSLSIGINTTAARRITGMDIIAPNAAVETMYSGFHTETNNADAFTFGGCHLTATAYDGFELFTSAGAQTVEYSLYGYRA